METATGISPFIQIGKRIIRLQGDESAIAWLCTYLVTKDETNPSAGGHAAIDRAIVLQVRCPEADGTVLLGTEPLHQEVPVPCLIVVPDGARICETALARIAQSPVCDVVFEPADAPRLVYRIERLLSILEHFHQLETAFENFPESVHIRTFDGWPRKVNGACLALMNKSREQVMTQTLYSGWHDSRELQEQIKSHNEAVLRDGAVHVLRTASDQRGRTRSFDLHAFLLRDLRGEANSVQVVVRDVTSEETAKERLQLEASRNQLLASIATATRDSTDFGEIFAQTSEQLCEWLGVLTTELWFYDEEQEVFRVQHHWRCRPDIPDFTGLERPLSKSPNFRALKESLRRYVVPDVSALDQNNVPTQVLRKMGAGSVLGTPIQHEGKLIGILGVTWPEPRPFENDEMVFFTRVADLLALALKSARMYQDLERQLLALAEVQKKRDEAEMDRQSLSAMLVHDLKNPLTSILATLELTHDRLKAGGDRRLLGLLTNARASGTVLRGLIEDALYVYRPESAPLMARLPTLVEDAMAHPFEEARLRASLKQIHFRTRVDPGIPQVPLDRSRFQRAVVNLIGNAIKFTPSGGTVDIHAQVREKSGEAYLMVSVSDTGPGLPEEARPLLGKPFTRFRGSEEIPGTGLGLTVVDRVAREHQGWFEAGNREGGGSTFTLWIPISQKAGG